MKTGKDIRHASTNLGQLLAQVVDESGMAFKAVSQTMFVKGKGKRRSRRIGYRLVKVSR